MIDHLKIVDNLKLWAAFAQLGLEDPPTAAAALGCLAMAVRDPEVRINVEMLCTVVNIQYRFCIFIHSVVLTVLQVFVMRFFFRKRAVS